MTLDSVVNVTQRIEASRFSGLQKRVVILALALAIADGFNSLAVGYAIPSLSEKWGVSPGAFSWAIVAAVIGEIIASVTLAPLADRLGRRTMIWVGILLFGVSTLCAMFVPNLAALIALRFIAGLGIGTASPNLFALSSDYSPKRFKATGVTILGTGMALGGSICGFFAGLVVPRFGGESIFLLAGGIPLLMLLLTSAFLPDSLEIYAAQGKTDRIARILNRIERTDRYTPEMSYVSGAGERVARVTVVELFRRGRATSTVLVWVMLLLGITGSYFVFSWLTTLLVMSGVDEATAIFGTSISTFGGVVGGILLGIMMDRLRIGVASLLLATVVQVLTTLVLASRLGERAPDGFVIVASLLLGFGIVGSGTALTAVAAQVYPPELRATGIGWAAGFSRLGAIFAPLAGGALIDAQIAPTTILLLSLIPAVVNGVLFLVFRQIGRFAGAPVAAAETAREPALA